jgi:hypothetical protein
MYYTFNKSSLGIILSLSVITILSAGCKSGDSSNRQETQYYKNVVFIKSDDHHPDVVGAHYNEIPMRYFFHEGKKLPENRGGQ